MSEKTPSEFAREYLCVPALRDKMLADLVAEYHSRTRTFDVLLCGGDGTPRDARQHGRVNRHACSVIADLSQRSGYTKSQIEEAIRNDRRHRNSH